MSLLERVGQSSRLFFDALVVAICDALSVRAAMNVPFALMVDAANKSENGKLNLLGVFDRSRLRPRRISPCHSASFFRAFPYFASVRLNACFLASSDQAPVCLVTVNLADGRRCTLVGFLTGCTSLSGPHQLWWVVPLLVFFILVFIFRVLYLDLPSNVRGFFLHRSLTQRLHSPGNQDRFRQYARNRRPISGKSLSGLVAQSRVNTLTLWAVK